MPNCSALTKITPNTVAITKELVSELRVSTYDRSPGTKVSVSCQFDLELVGQSQVICGNNGQWSGSPYCRDPPTTTTSNVSSGLDESTILLIVLVVTVVLVLTFIIVICGALYYKRRKRRREKGDKKLPLYGEVSTPYSLSDKIVSDNNNVEINSIYTTTAPYDYDGYRNQGSNQSIEPYQRSNTSTYKDGHFGNRKQYRRSRSHDDIYYNRVRFYDLHVSEPYEHRWRRGNDESFYRHRLYVKAPRDTRCPPTRRPRRLPTYPLYSQDTEMRHSKSAESISSKMENSYCRDEKDGRSFRRDQYLWGSMANLSEWNVPRPYYGK